MFLYALSLEKETKANIKLTQWEKKALKLEIIKLQHADLTFTFLT